jgi:hypothetical protein
VDPEAAAEGHVSISCRFSRWSDGVTYVTNSGVEVFQSVWDFLVGLTLEDDGRSDRIALVSISYDFLARLTYVSITAHLGRCRY